MVLEITDQNFESILNNAQPVVIDFWAQWCGPCKAVGTSIDAMAEDYVGKAVIGKVDVDTNPNLTSKFGVRNMPTVLFMKNGEILDKQVGSTSRMTLEKKLEAIL